MPRNQTVLNSNVIDAATAEQIAKTESLVRSILASGKKINSPYSIIISSIVFPFLAKLLFLNELSPLNSLYKQLRDRYFQDFLPDYQYLAEQVSEAKKLISGARTQVELGISQARSVIQAAKNIPGNTMNFNEFIDFIEAASGKKKIAADIPLDILFAEITTYSPKSANTLKTVLLMTSKICAKIMRSHISEATLANYNLSQLYNFLNITCPQAEKRIEHAAPLVAPFTAAASTLIVMNGWMFAVEFALCLIGKNLIDSVLSQLFPTGIGQAKIPVSVLQREGWVTQSDEAEKIKILQKIEKDSANIAKRNVQIARYLSALLIFLVLYYLWNTINPSAGFLFLCLSIFAAASSNLFSDLKYYYDTIQFDRRVESTAKAIATMTDLGQLRHLSIKPIIQAYELESSSFSLHSQNQQHISLLVVALLKYKVKIISYDNRNILLPANQLLPVSTCNEVKAFFETLLAQKEKIKKLRAQIQEVAKVLGQEQVFIETLNDNDLPICNCDFLIPFSHIICIEQIKTIFSPKKIAPLVTDQIIGSMQLISLIGLEPAEQNQLETLLRSIKTIHASNISSIEAIEQTTTTTIKHVKKAKRTTASDKIVVQEKVLLPRTILWPRSGKRYDAMDSNSQVYPIRDGRPLNKHFFNTCRRFVCHSFKKENLPARLADELLRKIDQLIENAHIVSSEGMSGLVCEIGVTINNNTKNLFVYEMKGKFLGTQGISDCRIYAEREVTMDQEEQSCSLYNFKGIELHAH